jgi:hypothetical protein
VNVENNRAVVLLEDLLSFALFFYDAFKIETH